MRQHYLPAEIYDADVAQLRLVDLTYYPDRVQLSADLVYGSIGLWLRREDVARLLFDGQAERIAFFQTAAAVSEAVRDAERVGR